MSCSVWKNEGGTWKQATQVWQNVAGVWKHGTLWMHRDGSFQSCPSDPACTPLPTAAAAFIADPSDYTRDGVSYNAVKGHADRVFPLGPRPFVGTHNAATSDFAKLGSHGFTVVHQSYKVYSTLNDLNVCMSAGMKMIFPFRDYQPPLDQNQAGGHGGDRDLWTAGHDIRVNNNWTKFNVLKKAFDAVSDLVNHGSQAQNDAVIGWGTKFDDGLGNLHYPANEPTHLLADYQRCAMEMYQYVHSKDPRNRGAVDLPKPAYGWQQENDVKNGKWQNQMQDCCSQLYWNDDVHQGNHGRTNVYLSKAAFGQRISRTKRLVDYARHTLGNGAPGNRARNILPVLWVGGDNQNGQDGYSHAKREAYKRNNRISDILSAAFHGAHGYLYFSVVRNHFFIDSEDIDGISEVAHTLTSNKVMSAMLWGKRKTDISKTALTNTTYQYLAEAQNDLKGLQQSAHCGSPTGCPAGGYGGTGKVTCNSKGNHVSCNYIVDMIVWMNIQFKGARYLIVTNLMPNEDTWHYYKNRGDWYVPTPGENGLANFSIQSRFSLPAMDYTGLKCIDVLSGKDAAAEHEFDAAQHRITVTLAPSESRVYKFSVDDGYCGGSAPDVPLPAPVITLQPQDIGLKVGDPVHTFHVDYTPSAAAVQWQWAHHTTGGDWRDIPGATGKSYTMTDGGSGVVAGQDGDEHRVRITVAGHAPIYSRVATVSIVADNTVPFVSKPTDQSTAVGGRVTFSVSVNHADTISWQYSTDHIIWHSIANQHTTSYTIASALLSQNNYWYRVVATNVNGKTIGDHGVLHVTETAVLPTVSTLHDLSIADGSTAKFTIVAAHYTNLKWQWQNAGETVWNDTTNTSLTFTTPVLHHSDSGKQYRVEVTGPGGTIHSNVSTVTVEAPLPVYEPKAIAASMPTNAYPWQLHITFDGLPVEVVNAALVSALQGTHMTHLHDLHANGSALDAKVARSASGGAIYALTVVIKDGALKVAGEPVAAQNINVVLGPASGGTTPAFVPAALSGTVKMLVPHRVVMTFNGTVNIANASGITAASDPVGHLSNIVASGNTITADLISGMSSLIIRCSVGFTSNAITVGGKAWSGLVVCNRV